MDRKLDIDGILRCARYGCEHLGDMGWALIGAATWVEMQLPRVQAAWSQVVAASRAHVVTGESSEEPGSSDER